MDPVSHSSFTTNATLTDDSYLTFYKVGRRISPECSCKDCTNCHSKALVTILNIIIGAQYLIITKFCLTMYDLT